MECVVAVGEASTRRARATILAGLFGFYILDVQVVGEQFAVFVIEEEGMR